MKSITLSRKFWILFSTIFIVAAVFAFYFLVYVAAQEAELREKKFRALAQYAININESYREASKKILTERRREIEAKKGDPDRIDSLANTKLWKAKQEIVNRQAKDDAFDELLIQIDTSIMFQTFNNILSKDNLGSLFVRDTNMSIKRTGTFNVNDREYLLFMHQFQLSDDFNAPQLWRIYGLSLKDSFQRQARAVELILALVICLILIIILIAMPLLKLWVMNELEKLQMMNIWFTGFSVIVGSSFIVLMVLLGNDFVDNLDVDNQRQTRNTKGKIFDRDERLKSLSDSVLTQFTGELRDIYDQLVECRDSERLLISLMPCPYQGGVLRNPEISGYFSKYRSFNEILWIKKDGSQEAMLATHDIDLTDPDLNLNLQERKYFSWVLADSTWLLPDATSPAEAISLQSIHSYRTGNHEAGIGIPWNDGVLAIATRLSSVMDPLLPPGYQFCIIDREGMVWFHSNTDKNRQENFLDETSYPGKLMAALNGRLEVPLSLKYEHRNVRALVTPIPNMELFLVTLHDTEFYNSPIVLTSGFALVLIVFMLLIQGIHQVIIYACSVRYSQLRIRTFFLDWLRPKASCFPLYEKSNITQGILLIGLGALSYVIHERFLIVCLLTLPVYLTTYHYYIMTARSINDDPSQNRLPVPLRKSLLIASAFFIVIINLIGFYYLEKEGFWWIIVIQVVILLLLVFSWLKASDEFFFQMKMGAASVSNRLPARFGSHINYSPYIACLFLWLILVGVLPTYYFYKVGYYEELSAWTRYIELKSATAYEDRDRMLNEKLAKTFSKKDLRSILSSGNYLNSTTEVDTISSVANYEPLPCKYFYNLLFHGSPVISGQVELSRAAIIPRATDKKWETYKKKDNEGEYSIAIAYRPDKGEPKYYSSTHESYRFLKGTYWMISLVVLLLGIFGVFKMLHFCIKHIFGMGLLRIGNAKGISIAPGIRYFIVGLPYSGKRALMEEIISSYSPDKVGVLDLRTGRAIDVPPYASLIVLKHFEYGVNDHNHNEEKLKVFNKILDMRDTSVICVSNIEPSAIIEFYEKQALYYSTVKHDRELDGLYRKCSQAQRHWKNVLSGFNIHYKALQQGHTLAGSEMADELDHGEYLPTLDKYISAGQGTMQEKEEAVMQIEEMSQTYYQSLWSSFCNNEKFILYDLARDGFVNMRNIKVIRVLRQKGVIQFRDSLAIMNSSFNNFILSIVNEDEELKMEQEMRAKGSWNTLHLVLVITIISIIAFLGIAQQELFKNFQAILAAIVTLLPLLARFSGVFSGAKIKD